MGRNSFGGERRSHWTLIINIAAPWLIHLRWLRVSSYCLIPNSIGKDQWEGLAYLQLLGTYSPELQGETQVSNLLLNPHGPTQAPRLPSSRTSTSHLFSCILTCFPEWKKIKEEWKQAVETAQNKKYVHGRMLQIGSSSFTYVTPGKLPKTAHSSRHFLQILQTPP